MRTNVVIDDTLMAEAMQLTGIKTKRGVIDKALRMLVRLERQRAVLALEGAVTWEGDLDSLRTVRRVAEEGTDYDAGSS
ncbi:MAG: type II toxin-antitoxin system VapB family antitoxin [Anaerolineae bacterium]